MEIPRHGATTQDFCTGGPVYYPGKVHVLRDRQDCRVLGEKRAATGRPGALRQLGNPALPVVQKDYLPMNLVSCLSLRVKEGRPDYR